MPRFRTLGQHLKKQNNFHPKLAGFFQRKKVLGQGARIFTEFFTSFYTYKFHI